jgi:predicted GIY-YIG superfamily endonuclease
MSYFVYIMTNANETVRYTGVTKKTLARVIAKEPAATAAILAPKIDTRGVFLRNKAIFIWLFPPKKCG